MWYGRLHLTPVASVVVPLTVALLARESAGRSRPLDGVRSGDEPWDAWRQFDDDSYDWYDND